MERLALVTGGGSGLGAASCRALAASGHRVVVVDINRASAEKVTQSLPGSGHVTSICDVTDEAAVIRTFAEAEKIAPVAVLVCFAGGTFNTDTYRPKLTTMSTDEWGRTEALNARSSFFCLREYLRWREKTPVAQGRVILVSSAAAQYGGAAAGAAYAAAKGAVLGLTKAAAREAAPMGITVNAISPGPFDTPAFHVTNSQAHRETMEKNLLLQRIGMPAEMGAVVAFLASEGSGFITGSTIDVNGGSRLN
jgi:NAD(P)-dependent dehydrogenase (short-subunit alcohol dehydrogenase family)